MRVCTIQMNLHINIIYFLMCKTVQINIKLCCRISSQAMDRIQIMGSIKSHTEQLPLRFAGIVDIIEGYLVNAVLSSRRCLFLINLLHEILS